MSYKRITYRDLSMSTLNENDVGAQFNILNDAEINELYVNRRKFKRLVGGQIHRKSNGTLEYWHILNFKYKDTDINCLIGWNYGIVYCTSSIVSMSPDRKAIMTENGSIYRLRKQQARQEPCFDLLVHIVYVMRAWGYSECVDRWCND